MNLLYFENGESIRTNIKGFNLSSFITLDPDSEYAIKVIPGEGINEINDDGVITLSLDELEKFLPFLIEFIETIADGKYTVEDIIDIFIEKWEKK